MRTLLAILLIVSVIAAIAYFWKDPQAYNTISSALLGQSQVQAEQPLAQPDSKPAEEAAAKKPAKAVRSRAAARAPVPVEEPAPVVVAVVPDQKTPDPQEDPLHATVKTDSAAIYVMNSSRSSVVHHLKKGDQVETELEVVDSTGRWSLVRIADINRSGFVRSENLVRQQIAARD